PHAVGFTKLKLADGREVVVWYPAAKESVAGHATESIDVASMLSPALQAQVPASKRPLYTVEAYDGAPAEAVDGGYPLVVFSHGFAGFPEQSVSLVRHLASWGFVVAAPDHVSRSLDGLLGTAAQGVPKASDTAVLQATTELMLTSSRGTGLLH